jgi:hypothetical protein
MEEVKLLGLDLSTASEQVIEILVEDATDPEIIKDILASNAHRPEILKLLMENPNVPRDMKEEVGKQHHLQVTFSERHKAPDEGRKHNLFQKIQQLTVGERIAIALRGGQEVRSILLKDANKEVVLTVLKNPKITETEVELIAHSRNVPEDALRAIHKNREWIKNYSINLALVNNPKTPLGIAVTLLTALRTKDLVLLEKNKNVPEAIRATAKKLLHARKPH